MKTILAVILLSLCSATSAAMLDSKFVNEDGDTICVYKAHFEKQYVNVGKTGICHLVINDRPDY